MNLDGAIQSLFPKAINGIDYLLQDDSEGKGPYIKEWNLTEDQPPKMELEVASLAYETELEQKEAARLADETELELELAKAEPDAGNALKLLRKLGKI